MVLRYLFILVQELTKTFMKTFKRTSLPDSVTVNGSELKLNAAISTGMQLNGTHPNKIAKSLRKEGRKCAMVLVMSKNLKGRTDLYGNEYKPTQHIFTN